MFVFISECKHFLLLCRVLGQEEIMCEHLHQVMSLHGEFFQFKEGFWSLRGQNTIYPNAVTKHDVEALLLS